MLPRDFLRENAERLLAEIPERFAGSGLEQFVELDRRRRDAVTSLEEKRRRRNELTSVKGKPSPEALTEMKSLKEEIRQLEEQAESDDAQLAQVETRIPNVPLDTVPRGKDETSNRVERTWGEPRRFAFEPQAHWDLGPALGILDFERGVKLAGARLTVLRGAGARLSRALSAFMLDLHTREHGYDEISPPVLANADSLFGTGPASQVRRGPLPDPRGLLPDPDRRNPAHQPAPRRDPSGRGAADPVHGLHVLLSRRGGRGGARHARDDPPAPVREGRAHDVREHPRTPRRHLSV